MRSTPQPQPTGHAGPVAAQRSRQALAPAFGAPQVAAGNESQSSVAVSTTPFPHVSDGMVSSVAQLKSATARAMRSGVLRMQEGRRRYFLSKPSRSEWIVEEVAGTWPTGGDVT